MCGGCLKSRLAPLAATAVLFPHRFVVVFNARHATNLAAGNPQLQWLGGALVRCGEGRGPAPFLGGRLDRNPACNNMCLLDCPRPLITCSYTVSEIGFFCRSRWAVSILLKALLKDVHFCSDARESDGDLMVIFHQGKNAQKR